MLARVTNGKNGIVEYLEHGVKSGRELSRDELDERVCIDGSLNITDSIIKNLNDSGRERNYLHITLSFGEKDISRDDIIKAYGEYKDKVMNAFHSDEYNTYAEIHLPKVKSYKDKKINETIERFPHVHMVIPLVNVVSGKAIEPFGKYTSNIDYHDSIQESINRALTLESPYDHQRKYRIAKDDSEFISRYKGDNFKGSNAEFKNELFESINNKNIRSMSAFESELSKYGEVSKGKLGSNDEYFKVKLFGETKNIRLKETCFNSNYIEDRKLLRPKPTDKQVNTLVSEWVNTRSHEMKHIQQASPTLREKYHSLNPEQKEDFLNERRRNHDKKHNLGERRRTTNRKPSAERVGLKRFTEIRNGLPSLPQRGLVRANRERTEVSQSVLPSDANHHLESSRASRDHQLRRPVNRSRGDGVGRRVSNGRVGLPEPSKQLKVAFNPIPTSKPRTLTEQYLQDHLKDRRVDKEIDQYRVIRKELKPERLLQHFKDSHGLVPENYSTFKAKDGSARIKIGARAYNVSDFCTKHMGQSWEETKLVLAKSYQEQRNELEDKSAINSIAFVSRYVTQGYSSKAKLQRLEESIQILKHLQQQEKFQGNDTMALADLQKYRVEDLLDNNTISNAEISLLKTADNFKRQQAIAKQLSLKMSDVVAIRDVKNKRVDFADKASGDKLFKDVGDKIVMSKRSPELDHVSAAMTLAAEKFGSVKITGTKAFKQQVIDVAIAKDLNIVFDSPKLQQMFIEQKAAHEQKQMAENTPDHSVDKPANTNEQKQSQDVESKTTIVSFGVAPYMNDKNNDDSYHVTLSNGKTHWGVGLKDAIDESKAKVGDEVSITKKGTETVEINVPVKDDQGKVIASEQKEVERGVWSVEVVNAAKEQDKDVDSYKVDYKWLPNENRMSVTINDKSPSETPTSALEKIAHSDRFLGKYSIETIQSGKLDLSVADGQQPVPRQFDANGDVVQTQEQHQPQKLTQ
ncbi:relaxase NikB [Vibrio tasmaniensis ZS-17]|uniref:LPD7 domain-containing protein n=1 Tax=Vibrio tasmaniensis TaxID=212663 RepID=UPI000372767C|nr:LPD7 domain-containing protein [Vibrio tasmaniensis]OED65909.1 relaxase NikB [Vibrio tasmaniensis ZS-17]